MSISMTKGDGVTVFTVTSDPQSHWPPLCQILKALCYNPACCAVSQDLRRTQRTSLSVLGTLHIMGGLLHIGLGLILCLSHSGSGWQMDETAFPFWLGALFILFGITCIWSEKRPSPCLVIVNVILNLTGVGFAIAAVILYSLNLAFTGLWWMCESDFYDYYPHHTTAATSLAEDYKREKCFESKAVVLMLLRSINAVLIVLSVLELCICISSAVLGIKALRSSGKGENKSADDPEIFKPLLEEGTTN